MKSRIPEITTSELAIMMMQGFEHLENSLRAEIQAWLERLSAEMHAGFERTEEQIAQLRKDIDRVELRHSRRLDALEERSVIPKSIF